MTNQMEELFTDRPEGGGGEHRREGEAIKARARVVMPNRKQLEFRASDLESLLPEGHRARLVWEFVERCDLRSCCMRESSRARARRVGMRLRRRYC